MRHSTPEENDLYEAWLTSESVPLFTKEELRMAKPTKRERRVTRKCDCGCCMLVFEKTVWDDGMTWYDVSVQDSRYDHDANGILNRIRNALKVLFGKTVSWNDVFFENTEDFDELLWELDELREWDGKSLS